MMIPDRSGDVTLASGNVFSWWRKNEPGRGACGGSFSADPSEADLQEAHGFIEKLVPANTQVVFDDRCDEAEESAMLAQHFAAGMSRN
jgi:hypothetical protein